MSTDLQTRFRVGGMDCASCASKIDTAVRRMPGVEDVSVSVTAGTMSIRHDQTSDLDAIGKKVRGLGYSVERLAGLQVPERAEYIRVINAELTRVGHAAIPLHRAIDTIEIAKRKLPGARYSLDELCKRFAIDLSARGKHGALLDAQLTAQVYLELIGGRQKGFVLAPAEIAAAAPQGPGPARQRPVKLPSLLTEEEQARHAGFIAKELGDAAVWLRSA